MTMAPTALTAAEAADLRSRMCGEKRPMTYEEACTASWRLRHLDGQDTINSYPCPFPPHRDEHRWHVGHAPSVERMRLLARFLRFGAEDG